MLTPLLRLGARGLVVVLSALVLIGVALVCANRWRTSAASVNPGTMPDPVSDGRSIKPAASSITVNSLSDVANGSDGLCTLREAITAANNNAASGVTGGECAAGSSSGLDAINFSVTGTIDLTAALPNISSDMTLNGPGSAQLTVRRSTSAFYRVFTITSGNVGLTGITVRDGRAPDGAGTDISAGGGIWNNGTLNLTDVSVISNRAGDSDLGHGGAIFNQGSLTTTTCLASGNAAGNSGGTGGSGGGIYNSGK
jgi:CSLREA domain-containing protein